MEVSSTKPSVVPPKNDPPPPKAKTDEKRSINLEYVPSGPTTPGLANFYESQTTPSANACEASALTGDPAKIASACTPKQFHDLATSIPRPATRTTTDDACVKRAEALGEAIGEVAGDTVKDLAKNVLPKPVANGVGKLAKEGMKVLGRENGHLQGVVECQVPASSKPLIPAPPTKPTIAPKTPFGPLSPPPAPAAKAMKPAVNEVPKPVGAPPKNGPQPLGTSVPGGPTKVDGKTMVPGPTPLKGG